MVRTSGTYALGQATTMCIGECVASRMNGTRNPTLGVGLSISFSEYVKPFCKADWPRQEASSE